MNLLKGFKKKLNSKQKIYVFAILFILIILSFGIPSLARYKNRLPIDNTSTWDGTTSSSYRKGTGTVNDPYIISNAKELAYFSLMLETNDYLDTYFKLNNNIIINNGVFNYVDNKVTYTLNNTTFYLKNNTNEFYDNNEFTGIKIGTVNILNAFNNFKGNFDGNGFTIYGAYIKGSNEVGLFTNLNGSIHDLYVKNTLINGGITNGGIASNATDSIIKNVVFEGNVIEGSISGGIIGSSNNTSLEQVINKSNINSSSYAGGLIGQCMGTTNIIQSYNIGNINSNVSAGLIGNIENNINNVNIIKSYNIGLVEGTSKASLIGFIKNNTGIITLNRIVNNTETPYMINTIESSIVNVESSYKSYGNNTYLGTINGTFTNNLVFDKTFMTNLGYDEFIDNTDLETNGGHVWMYEDNLPILYIDDIKNPIANLYVSTYKWNNIGYVLDKIYFNSNITFLVQELSETRPIKNAYFHIESSDIPLSKIQIDNITDWQDVSLISPITTDGKYIIYIKIVDTFDSISYINSEVLILDTVGSDVSINNTWTSFSRDVSTIFIDSPKTYTISASDNTSLMKEINYYVSQNLLTIEELNNIEFINYVDGVNINEYGSYIIYAKVIDNSNNITYVNSDMIRYGGYSLKSIKAGRSNESLNDIYITNKSNIIMNFTYSDNGEYSSGYNHRLVSNVSLPINTKLMLINNKTNEKYINVINSETSNILFASFKKIGKKIDENFVEPTSGNIDEDYSVVIDFSNTQILSNMLNVIIHLELDDGISSRTTLSSTLKPFNVYINKDATISISTTYNGVIGYDSTSTNTIPLKVSLNYNYINNIKINDTTYEDKIIGLYIKMVDNNGNIISKEYLKNIKFKINNTYYSVSNDSIVRIKLDNGLNPFNDNLIIETVLDNSNLPNGNFFFKIYATVSYDGENTNELSSELVTIPVNNNSYKYDYNYNVIYNNDTRIINKTGNTKLDFSILQNGRFISPNVRVSLYKKKDLTAYIQDYEIIDLKEYITDELENVSPNVYYAVKSPLYFNGRSSTYNNISINLINNKFEYNSYKLIFELYDGNTFVSTIGETFIIK